MNYIIKVSGIIGILICFVTTLSSQDLPTPVDKTKCYGKAKTPDKFHIQEQKILLRPAFEQEIVIPAEYKVVEKKVEVASQPQRIMIPTTATDFQSLDQQKTPESKVVMNLIPVSESTNICPNDCDEIEVPGGERHFDVLETNVLEEFAENIKSKTNKLLEREKFEHTLDDPQNRVKGVEDTDRALVDHPQYKVIEEKVLVKPEEVKTITVPAEYKVIRHKTLIEKGGVAKWVEVLCPKSINALLVTQLQLALQSRKYYEGELHGILSFDVRSALVKFQQENQLPLGQLDKQTLEALGFNFELVIGNQ